VEVFSLMALQPLLGPGLFFSSVIIFYTEVGFLGGVISSSQGRYLHTGQHKYRINAYTDIHASSGIRTYDPSVRASEDSSCLRTRSHSDRHSTGSITIYFIIPYRSIVRQRLGKHIPEGANARKNRTSIARQRVINTPKTIRAIEEGVFHGFRPVAT
jgi:hypothetical protein